MEYYRVITKGNLAENENKIFPSVLLFDETTAIRLCNDWEELLNRDIDGNKVPGKRKWVLDYEAAIPFSPKEVFSLYYSEASNLELARRIARIEKRETYPDEA